MNLLLYGEIAESPSIPGFGHAFEMHIAAKTHPAVRRASLSAWKLLARAMEQLGYETLPTVRFLELGKPAFENNPLHFSISHSGNMAAALVSDAPCAVDVECIRPETAARLAERCLSPREKAHGCGFFEAWTQKECIAKRNGTGMPAHPCAIDTLDSAYAGQFFSREIRDVQENIYLLTALCENRIAPEIQRMSASWLCRPPTREITS